MNKKGEERRPSPIRTRPRIGAPYRYIYLQRGRHTHTTELRSEYRHSQFPPSIHRDSILDHKIVSHHTVDRAGEYNTRFWSGLLQGLFEFLGEEEEVEISSTIVEFYDMSMVFWTKTMVNSEKRQRCPLPLFSVTGS